MIHSEYSPSRMERIILCPGSTQLCRTVAPGEPSSHAQRGTRLHGHMENLLENSTADVSQTDEDIVEQVQLQECLDYVNVIKATLGGEDYIQVVERKVDLDHLDLSVVYGYLDLGIKCPARREAHVFDWKFGFNEVDARKNPQQMIYASGFLNYQWENYDHITMHIVQPSIDNYDSFKMTPGEINAWINDKVRNAILQAESRNPMFKAGEKQCKWCDAAPVCRTRHAQMMQDIACILDARENFQQISINEMCAILQKAKRVEDGIAAMNQFVFNAASQGKETPGFKLVRGRSSRAWKDPDAVVKFLDDYIPDDMFISKLVSPNQAEQRNKALKKNPEFEALYEKSEGKLTLAKETDRRAAVSPVQHVKSMFDVIMERNNDAAAK